MKVSALEMASQKNMKHVVDKTLKNQSYKNNWFNCGELQFISVKRYAFWHVAG